MSDNFVLAGTDMRDAAYPAVLEVYARDDQIVVKSALFGTGINAAQARAVAMQLVILADEEDALPGTTRVVTNPRLDRFRQGGES